MGDPDLESQALGEHRGRPRPLERADAGVLVRWRRAPRPGQSNVMRMALEKFDTGKPSAESRYQYWKYRV